MDPNAVLQDLRDALSAFWSAQTTAAGAVLASPLAGAADDLATAADALDSWLRKGGFLPTDWSAHR